MKKSLIAVAVAAALPAVAFAQSSVTLSGNLDFAVGSFTGSQQIAKGTTITTSQAAATTSVINVSAIEDLGGGIKAQVWYGIDPRGLANDGLAPGRDEVYAGITGGFGRIRLGSPNSLGLFAHLDSQPLGTGIGSGYAPIGAGNGMISIVNTRYSRSLRYDSPAVMGFTGAFMYIPGNDRARDGGLPPSANLPENRPGMEYAVRYSQGPLNASLTMVQQSGDKYSSGAAILPDDPVTKIAPQSTSVTLLAANYKIADTTLYAGYNTGDRLASSGAFDADRGIAEGSKVKSKGYRFAVKHDIGAISLAAAYTTNDVSNVGNGIPQGDDTTKYDYRWSTLGLRADYNFSKMTRVYLGYENHKTGFDYVATSAALAAATGDRKIVSVGLKQSF